MRTVVFYCDLLPAHTILQRAALLQMHKIYPLLPEALHSLCAQPGQLSALCGTGLRGLNSALAVQTQAHRFAFNVNETLHRRIVTGSSASQSVCVPYIPDRS